MDKLKIRNADEEIEILPPMGKYGHCITLSNYLGDISEIPYETAIMFLKEGQAEMIAEFLMKGVEGCRKD